MKSKWILLRTSTLFIILLTTTLKSHYRETQGLCNGLLGMSYTFAGLLTTCEAAAHNHRCHSYHRHCHWKKQAESILKEIKIYRETGELNMDFRNKLESMTDIKEMSLDEKINFIETLITDSLALEEDDAEEDEKLEE